MAPRYRWLCRTALLHPRCLRPAVANNWFYGYVKSQEGFFFLPKTMIFSWFVETISIFFHGIFLFKVLNQHFWTLCWGLGDSLFQACGTFMTIPLCLRARARTDAPSETPWILDHSFQSTSQGIVHTDHPSWETTSISIHQPTSQGIVGRVHTDP